MSRLRLLAHNISSGYTAIAANAVFTLVSVRLALHYVSLEEYGLLALVTTVVGYLSLVDLGMTGAMMRVLIDHKDSPSDGIYGSVIKTSSLVLLLQGTVLGALAWGLSWWLAGLMEVPETYARPFRLLFLGYGLLAGALFPGRILAAVLQAHQRHDMVNYSNVVSFVVNLAALWIGFRIGLGLFSLLAAQVAGAFSAMLIQAAATVYLRFLPPSGAWGGVNRKHLREIFLFGNDLFLMNVGLQLLNASQAIIIKMLLGLEAVAVWTIATKAYAMAQQFVWRLWDFSASTIAEMVVRDERPRLLQRFREIFLVTASVSAFIGIAVAVCNNSFITVWTATPIRWPGLNDVLMAVLFVSNSVTRLHIGLMGATKKILAMRYLFFLEGLCFVTAAYFSARAWGIPAIIASAAVMNIAWSGIYGTLRTAAEFRISLREVACRWIAPAARFAMVLAAMAFLCFWSLRPLPALPRLMAGAAAVSLAGAVAFWRLGLTESLRQEFRSALRKIWWRFRAFLS